MLHLPGSARCTIPTWSEHIKRNTGTTSRKLKHFSLGVGLKMAMLEELPEDIKALTASYLANVLQACDPRCYRAARCLQAAWRGWAARFQEWHCDSCTHKMFMGIKRVKYSGRVYARVTFAALPHWMVRRYMPGGLPRHCCTCRRAQVAYQWNLARVRRGAHIGR